jgi:hypothetical protein
MSIYNTFATWEHYIIYLRKSRQDDPRETVEEVLEKHETMLQEYAVREFGHKIPEENIYREVVSGESISEREEIKLVLSRITDPNIKGVLVVEPSRLSRGDLVDCGHLIDALRYSKTLVVTPYMTYDLENKMERKFFQDELLRGNDYLEYTKEILWRGRVAAAKRGCYSTGGPAPYGYKKVKDGKDWILEIVPEHADIVRMIYNWYITEDISFGSIGRRLNDMGVQSPSGEGSWKPSSVRKILQNKHYLGLIVFNRVKATTFYEDGEKIKRLVKQKPEDVIIAKGKHPAIIDEETFEAAARVTSKRPKYKVETELKNCLSTLLVCGKCGRAMARDVHPRSGPRYVCKAHVPQCFKYEKVSVVLDALIVALESSELPELKLKVKNNEGNAVKIQHRLIEKLRAQLVEFETQEESLYDLLEQKVYTPDVFTRRHSALTAKMDACREDLEKAKRAMPKSINYEERVETLERAIALLKDPDATPEEQNKVLRSIISRIEYHGTEFQKCKYGENYFTLKVFLRL